METLQVHASDPDAIPRALSVLQAGGLVAFPTDTVYGVGALAFHGPAIERIYAAKGRPEEKAIPILLAEAADLGKVAEHLPPLAQALAAHFWPGPLTLVVPKAKILPEAVSSTATVAVRVPDHPVARALLRQAGPMAVTSANISGQDSPVTAEGVMQQLAGRIHMLIDGGRTPGGVPSTLVDCMGELPRILREGPITVAQIEQVLRDS